MFSFAEFRLASLAARNDGIEFRLTFASNSAARWIGLPAIVCDRRTYRVLEQPFVALVQRRRTLPATGTSDLGAGSRFNGVDVNLVDSSSVWCER